MRYEMMGGSAFPAIKVFLDKGESIKAESGGTIALSEGMALTGKMDGGFTKALGRMFTGESFFLQKIEAEQKSGWALLGAVMPGGISEVKITQGSALLVQRDGFLAGTNEISVSAKVQSIVRGLFSGEGFFVVKLEGSGTAFLSTYGSLQELVLQKGETVMVNNGHLVAWDADMKYDITKGAKTWFSAFTSGEGFACLFHGPGKVLIQTRNPRGLGCWLFPYLPIPSRTNN